MMSSWLTCLSWYPDSVWLSWIIHESICHIMSCWRQILKGIITDYTLNNLQRILHSTSITVKRHAVLGSHSQLSRILWVNGRQRCLGVQFKFNPQEPLPSTQKINGAFLFEWLNHQGQVIHISISDVDLVQTMASHTFCVKPLSEPMLAYC